MERALKDAADGDAAEVIGVVKIGDKNLERALGVSGGGGNGVDDGFKERLQIRARHSGVRGCGAGLGHGVEHGKIELVLVGVEVDEEIVNFVQHFLRAGIGTVNLVDDHDGGELGFEGLGEHVTSLRKGTLGGVDKQHHSVDHLERSFHFATKIGVAGGIDNIDFAAGKVDSCVLGQNGDAALALQLVGIHHPLGHLLIGAKGAGLAQHGIHECGLSMINMGDNGDIAYRLAHKFNFPSLVPS